MVSFVHFECTTHLNGLDREVWVSRAARGTDCPAMRVGMFGGGGDWGAMHGLMQTFAMLAVAIQVRANVSENKTVSELR